MHVKRLTGCLAHNRLSLNEANTSGGPGMEPRSLALQADSLPAEPQGKPKNTEVGSLIPSPSDFPDPGIKPKCPVLQVDSLPTELSEKPSML